MNKKIIILVTLLLCNFVIQAKFKIDNQSGADIYYVGYVPKKTTQQIIGLKLADGESTDRTFHYSMGNFLVMLATSNGFVKLTRHMGIKDGTVVTVKENGKVDIKAKR